MTCRVCQVRPEADDAGRAALLHAMLNPWWKHGGSVARVDILKSPAGGATPSSAKSIMTSSTGCETGQRYVPTNRFGAGGSSLSSRFSSSVTGSHFTSGVTLPGLGSTPMIIGCSSSASSGGTTGAGTAGNSGKLAALGVYDNLPPPG